MSHLARAQENRVLKERAQGFQRDALQRHYGDQRTMETASRFLETAEDRAEYRQFTAATKQAAAEEAVAQAQKEKLRTARVKADEAAVDAALASRSREQQRAASEVHRLQLESDELRTLRSNIQAAQVRMGQEMQLHDHERLAAAVKAADLAADRSMRQRCAKEDERVAEEDAQRRERGVQARHDLSDQMADNARLRQLAALEYQKERDAVDAIMQRIHEEDALSAAAADVKRVETQAFIASFLLQQQQIRSDAAAEMARQEQEMDDYNNAKQAQGDQRDAQRASNLKAADRIYKRLKAERDARVAEEEEHERLIDLMRAEQEEQRIAKEAEAQAAHREAMRADMAAANAQQLQFKAQQAEQRKVEEAAERVTLMEQYAANDRVEQLSAQRARLRVAEHRRAIEALLAAKREAFEQEQVKEEARQEAQQHEAARKAAIVATERARLLHGAAHLRAYLPRRDAQDIESLVGPAVRV